VVVGLLAAMRERVVMLGAALDRLDAVAAEQVKLAAELAALQRVLRPAASWPTPGPATIALRRRAA
jgi:hypothetical protein